MIIRDFAEHDVGTAVELFVQEWGKYSGATESIVRPLLEELVDEYLSKTTYAKVCEIDGDVEGILLGRIDGEKQLFRIERRSCKSFSQEGLAMMDLERETNRTMKERCKGLVYDCELVYFITSKKSRGHGIGSLLLDGFIEYAKAKGCKRMSLFTDDFCSFGYYERKGFARDATENIFIDNGYHDYFLYSKQL